MNQDPLAQLKDIHLPLHAETGWPAPGYWLILLLLITVTTLLLFVIWQYWQISKIKRNWIQQLQNIDINDANAVKKINLLLKKAALHYYPRHSVASLYGEKWLRFLLPSDQFS